MISPAMFKAILLPIDIWEPTGSLKHLSTAVGVARSCSCPVYALTVLPDVVAAKHYAYSVITFDEAVSEVKRDLEKLMRATINDEITWTSDVVRGEIYKEILKAERQHAVDLIVMAAHRPRMGDFLIGSNAEKVARHAKCSVLLVRD